MSPRIRAVTEQSTPYILGYPMGTVYGIGGLWFWFLQDISKNKKILN